MSTTYNFDAALKRFEAQREKECAQATSLSGLIDINTLQEFHITGINDANANGVLDVGDSVKDAMVGEIKFAASDFSDKCALNDKLYQISMLSGFGAMRLFVADGKMLLTNKAKKCEVTDGTDGSVESIFSVKVYTFGSNIGTGTIRVAPSDSEE